MVHIVIADNEPLILQLVGRAVSSLGWTFDTATNGAEALQLVEQVMPELVISDIRMPEMSGTELVQAMKSNPRLVPIPVILMSSSEMEAEALAAGCNAFISKPFAIKELLKLLRQLVAE